MERLIDDVARDMTEAKLPLDLRTAVLARLDRPRPWRLAYLAMPVTAAAILAVAITLRDRTEMVKPAPTTPQVAPGMTTPVADPLNTGVAEPLRRGGSPRRHAPVMSAIRSIPALPEAPPLAASNIQPDPLAIPLLQLKPIGTEPIAIHAIEDGPGGRE